MPRGKYLYLRGPKNLICLAITSPPRKTVASKYTCLVLDLFLYLGPLFLLMALKMQIPFSHIGEIP